MKRWIDPLLALAAVFMLSLVSLLAVPMAAAAEPAPQGSRFAWGNNTYGQLGNGGTADSSTPVQVSDLPLTSAIAAGESHSLAVANRPPVATIGGPYTVSEGSAATIDASGSSDPDGDPLTYAWDLDNDGHYDDATGATANFAGVDGPATQVVNVQVIDGQGGVATATATVTVTNVAPTIGAHEVFARAWEFGTTARGTYADVPADTVTIYASVGWIMQYSTGWVWMATGAGQADGQPVTVTATDKDGASSSVTFNLTVNKVSTISGLMFACGQNTYGQVGNGGTADSATFVQVSGLTDIIAVAGGMHHSLAVKQGGTVWAWGENSYGQLGTGGTANSTTPVQVPGLTGVTAVAAGESHSLALKDDGTVWAWGQNWKGQLGNGGTANSSTPVQVSGLTGIIAVAAGESHSLALKDDGTVWTWGWNFYGQVGNVRVGDVTTPLQVSGLIRVTAVAGGLAHSLALRDDGTVWAWGSNYYGQLGNRHYDESATPVQADIPIHIGAHAIAAGRYHSLSLGYDGTVWAWGQDWEGQLGNGGWYNSTDPVRVSGLTDITAIAGGLNHSLALKEDGTVWAWGYGQLGNGRLGGSRTPVQVSGLPRTGGIAAGGYHSLAMADPNNRPPVVDISGPGKVDEGSAATLDASGSRDPDGDPLTYDGWDLDNDGQYDDATGATATFTGVDGPATLIVSVRLSDGMGGVGASTGTVFVTNVDPAVAVNHSAVTVNGGETATNSGTFSDPGVQDDITLTASAGTLTKSGLNSGTWSWSFPTGYGPGQSQMVTITASDGDGRPAIVSFPLTVIPDSTPPVTTISGAPGGWTNQPANLILSASDDISGVAETHYSLDGGAVQTGTVLTVASDGIHSLAYWSVDRAGNEEPSHTATLQIDTTAPTITGTAGGMANAGWYKSDVPVTFQCADAGSGIASCLGSTTLTGEGSGQSVTGTATDYLGNSTQATVGGINIDKTAPSTSVSGVPAGWVNQSVSLTLSASDNLSGVAATYHSMDGGAAQAGTTLTVTGDGSHTVSYWSVDVAGNEESPHTATVQIDQTPPAVTGAPDRTANGNGWYNDNVTVTFTCDDSVSGGVASGVASCSPPVTLAQGASQTVTGTATDNAGNSASVTAGPINIDKVAPVVTYLGNAGSYTVDQTVAITCTYSDGLSGVAASTCADINEPAWGLAQGPHGYSATATDRAGNVGSGSTSFQVTVSFDSLCTLSRAFSTSDDVDQGLCDKLTAANAAAQRGNAKAKAGPLGAFISQVQAQTGKALTKLQAEILIRWVNLL